MKDVFATAIALLLLVIFIVTLWNAGAFLKSFGGNYNTFLSQTKVPIGEAQVPLAITEAELWASTNQTAQGISPYKGKVRIDPWDSDAVNEDASQEYITLRAAGTNTEAIRMTGWSIESLISHTRTPLPQGVLLFRLGEEQKKDEIYLAPGEYMYIVSGSSPAGTSFHTNTCIGQLANYKAFYPRLPENCPSSTALLSPTLQHVRDMGEKCLEYISTIPSCEIPREESMPKDLLPACKAYILQGVSYNQCIDAEQKKSGFKVYNGGGWYTYLEQPLELWRNKYEILRLLDESGRVVDVYSY